MVTSSHRFLMFHTCCSTCIQCTASDRFSQQPSSLEWTADMKGDLKTEKRSMIICWEKNASRWKCACVCGCFTRTATVWAGHQLFWLAGFLVQVGISQTKITVVVRQSQTVRTLLRSWPKENREYQSSLTQSMKMTQSNTASEAETFV